MSVRLERSNKQARDDSSGDLGLESGAGPELTDGDGPAPAIPDEPEPPAEDGSELSSDRRAR
eukprot:8886519-Lingulodinium_polyedra.AAC.1